MASLGRLKSAIFDREERKMCAPRATYIPHLLAFLTSFLLVWVYYFPRFISRHPLVVSD
uniref:Csu622 n=1 Tax=Arundo donax TaxID=35708 RepID=A0A0A9GPK7_ARUDO